MKEIRFEQAQFILNEQEKIDIYKKRFYEISKLFQKNPFLQLMRYDLYNSIMDFHEPIYNNDFSIFKKLLDQHVDAYSHYVIIPHFMEGHEYAYQMINSLPNYFVQDTKAKQMQTL